MLYAEANKKLTESPKDSSISFSRYPKCAIKGRSGAVFLSAPVSDSLMSSPYTEGYDQTKTVPLGGESVASGNEKSEGLRVGCALCMTA